MTNLTDSSVRRLLEEPNAGVASTLNADGSVHSTVVWLDVQDGRISMNSAVGRVWPTNLQRDPRVTVVVYDQKNPFEYVEVRGTASGTTDGADAHIDRLAKKYLDMDAYPWRTPGEQRITFVVDAQRVRHQKAG